MMRTQTHTVYRRAAAICLGVPGVLAAVQGARAEPAFYEEGGIVVAEVESTEAARWQESTDLDGFTGRCYLVDRGGGRLVYKIVIANGGGYNLRIRNRHDYPESDKQNDCWTSMDGGRRIKTYSSIRGEWTWATKHEDGNEHKDPVYELGPGIHVFEISGRSGGFMIDRFVLYRQDVQNPTDTSRRASSSAPEMPQLTELGRLERYWRRGMLGPALAYAEKRLDSSKPAEAAEARKVVDLLTGFAKERRDWISKMKPTAPAVAVVLLTDLARQFMPSKTGKDLAAEARGWATEPATVNDQRASLIFDTVKKAADKLEGKGTASDPAFARRYAREIQTIKMGIRALRARYPQTVYSSKATSISHKFAIDVE